MTALRHQNQPHVTGRTPSYYANNRQYPYSLAQNQAQTRTSRRLHEGLSIDRNYGLDTTSDDLNSSPYSSPYYINGRYNSTNLTTQTGNSASVQGTTRLLVVPGTERVDEISGDPEAILTMWQGKQIRFEQPYSGKITGVTLNLRNTGGCTGILSIYLSASPDGPVLAEMAIDLCEVNQDGFEHRHLYAMTPVPANANPRGVIYVRMEIWDEIACKRSANPFNTNRQIEIYATGEGYHGECINKLGEKNRPVKETYDFVRQPNRPRLGLIYNNWRSVPTNRTEGVDYGATVSQNGYLYHIFCIKTNTEAKIIIYDPQTKKVVDNDLRVDSRVENLNLIQAAGDVYYVDGYSPLQKFTIGEWKSIAFSSTERETPFVELDEDKWFTSELGEASGTYSFTYSNAAWRRGTKVVFLIDYGLTVTGEVGEGDTIRVSSTNDTVTQNATATYLVNNTVIAASLIAFHANRIWLAGFRYDPNLVQYSEITDSGPQYDSFVWRFYVPDRSPLSTSDNPITAMVEYEPDRLMIANAKGFSLYATTADPATELPTQVSIYSDGAGVAAAGDITQFRGIIYSFDPDEGIRRFTGSLWNKIPATLDSHIERVDMTKPRKLWGYAYKLYFNYTDSVDGKAKCIVWDMAMNYQQYPWFQDVDLPFCDVRADNDFNIIGIHPDFPCIMRLYDNDTWRRLDSPIVFERHTKRMSLPGNASDMILKRVFMKVMANSARWWWFALEVDTDTLYQERGNSIWYRVPVWPTRVVDQPVETPFPSQDIYEQYATALVPLPNLNIRAIAIQVKAKAKTFRSQANLISFLMEAQSRSYN